jgi:hypothetical protein
MYTGNPTKDLKALLPHIVADCHAGDRTEADLLVSKFNRIYACNPEWGKLIKDTNAGRDTLHAFMEHWHLAYLKTGRMD